MEFVHKLTLFAPYNNLPLKSGFKFKIRQHAPYVLFDDTVYVVSLFIVNDAEYNLAECQDYKTADSLVRLLESLVNPLVDPFKK